jgi:hypothetical protein
VAEREALQAKAQEKAHGERNAAAVQIQRLQRGRVGRCEQLEKLEKLASLKRSWEAHEERKRQVVMAEAAEAMAERMALQAEEAAEAERKKQEAKVDAAKAKAAEAAAARKDKVDALAAREKRKKDRQEAMRHRQSSSARGGTGQEAMQQSPTTSFSVSHRVLTLARPRLNTCRAPLTSCSLPETKLAASAGTQQGRPALVSSKSIQARSMSLSRSLSPTVPCSERGRSCSRGSGRQAIAYVQYKSTRGRDKSFSQLNTMSSGAWARAQAEEQAAVAARARQVMSQQKPLSFDPAKAWPESKPPQTVVWSTPVRLSGKNGLS